MYKAALSVVTDARFVAEGVRESTCTVCWVLEITSRGKDPERRERGLNITISCSFVANIDTANVIAETRNDIIFR